MGEACAADEEHGLGGRQACLGNAIEIPLRFGVTDGDDTAFGGEGSEGCSKDVRPGTNRRKGNLLALNPRGRQNLDKMGVRIAMLALPDVRLFKWHTTDMDAAVPGCSTGCGKGW